MNIGTVSVHSVEKRDPVVLRKLSVGAGIYCLSIGNIDFFGRLDDLADVFGRATALIGGGA